MESQHNHSVSMTCNFLLEEYRTLRKEIEETKSRIFKLAITGITGIPTAYFLVSNAKEKVLVLTLPFLIVTLLLLFLSESRSLMRCGKYIRERIETVMIQENNLVSGWEHWLEGEDTKTKKILIKNNDKIEIKKIQKEIEGRRSVNKILSFLFYLIFVIYYFASAILSASEFQNIMNEFDLNKLLSVELYFYFAFSLFVLGGVIFLLYLIKTSSYSNTTLYE